jgi:hypothetical protein
MAFIPDSGAGISSAGNSSVATLSGGATFTGTGELNAYPDVMVSCFANVAGTLFFDFSVNGADWRTFPPNGFVVSASVHEFHTAIKGPRYFRVRYINGSSAQSTFQLFTYYGAFRQANAPLNQSIGADSDATITRTVSSDLDLAFGQFTGMSEDTKYGFVKVIDAADNPVDVWAFATDTLSVRADTKTFPTSASTFYIASDAVADTSLAVTIDTIDSTGAAVTQVVTTDASSGRTPVALTGSLLDVNRAFLSGNNQTNTGNLYIITANNFAAGGTPNTPSQCVAFIPIGLGQTQQCSYTVPLGYRLRIKRVVVFMARLSGAAGSAEIQLLTRNAGGSWLTKREFFITVGTPVNELVSGLVFNAGAQIVFRLVDASDSDTNISAEFAFDLLAT